MDLRRVRAGEWIVGLSGLALLVSLFLPWYGDVTAWEAFAVLDVILALIGLASLAVPVVTAVQRVEAIPLAFESLTTLLGVPGLVLVVFRVLNLPGDLHGREWGLWVALAAALGIVGGGLVAMRDERLAGAREREIETLPAPRPEGGS